MDIQLQNIKNIIFDFGGVLVDLDRQRCEKSFQAIGIDLSPMLDDFHQHGVLADFESGEAKPPQFFEALRSLSNGHNPSDEQIWEAWQSFLVGVPSERLDMLIALKEHYRLMLLSNTNFIHWYRAQNDFFLYRGLTVEDLFEQIFLSFEMHLQKPQPAIFERVIEQTGIRPDETLFIDDSPANCKAADGLGIHTFCPSTPNDWIDLFHKPRT